MAQLKDTLISGDLRVTGKIYGYATEADLNGLISATDAMVFKGTIGPSGSTVSALPAEHNIGDTYRVNSTSTVSYAGQACENGDLIICITSSTTANNAHWTVAQTNIDGAVTGPASATGDRIATFNGTSGKVIKDSGYTTASFAASTHTHSKADISDFPTEMTPSTHSHGSITNDGKIGTTSGLAVVTGTGGAVTTADLSVADPTASGTAITFIATASTDSTGKLSVTKSTVRDASSSQSGVVSTGAQTFSGNKTFSNNVTVSGTTSVKSININGTTTATGTFTVSGATTLKGTTTISGATTVSGNFTTSGSTVTMSASTSITLKANEVRIQNSAGNTSQAGTFPYVTALKIGDGDYTYLREYKDDNLEMRGSSLLLNTATAIAAFSDTSTYNTGAYVWYDRAYWTCTTSVTTAGAWTGTTNWASMPASGIMTNSNLVPWKNNTYELGSSSYKWKNVYATTFVGTLSGKATGANITTTTNAVAYYSNTTGTFSSLQSKSGAVYSTGTNSALSFGTLPVAQGGTGATSFTATSVIVSGSTTTGALTTRSISNITTVSHLAWSSSTGNGLYIPTLNTLAYWNGRYNSSTSNLAYCNKGAFGTGATKNISTGTAAPSGGSNGDIYLQYEA